MHNSNLINERFHVKLMRLQHPASETFFSVIFVLVLKKLEKFQVRTAAGQR